MKANNNYKLANLPDGMSYAKNSVLIRVNCTDMETNDRRTIPTGASIIAQPISLNDALPGRECVIVDTSNQIHVGEVVKLLPYGVTIKAYSKDCPAVFLHGVLLLGIYLITDVHIPRNTKL